MSCSSPKDVLMTFEYRGTGVAKDPHREIRCFWDKETYEKLGEIDHFLESKK